MKKNMVFPALILAAALALSGCSGKNPDASSPEASSGPAVSAKSAVSQDAPGTGAASPAPSEASSAAGPQGGSVSQNEPVRSIQTDDAEFGAKFKKNPIDKQYLAEMENAVSNTDMVKVSDKYAGAWQKEITHAYGSLKKALQAEPGKWKTIETDQQAWESGKDAALQKIASDAEAAGGSLGLVDAASNAMNFYRDRAAKLYGELYAVDKDYTYLYQKP